MTFGLIISFSPLVGAQSISQEDQQSIYNDTVWYKPSGSSCNNFSLTGSSGSISPLVGKGMSPAAQTRFQQILVAAGTKFNVSPNFIASFYYAENSRSGDLTNNADSAQPPPVTGDGSWREPAPPYGHGGRWKSNPDSQAAGPFQFIPSTWGDNGVDGNGDGSADANDLTDAAFGAANYIAKSGGVAGASESDLRKAAFAYNHSDIYVQSVINTFSYLSSGGQSTVSGAVCSSGGSTISAYKNPLRSIQNLVPRRIDQGVDYSGSGPIYAIGNAKINIVTTSSAWPAGTYINYTLADGPAAGKNVFFAENCKPTVNAGDIVTSDTTICNMIDHDPNIETGWAADPTEGYLAMAHNVYVEGHATASGVNFSDLMKALGAPGGTYQYPGETPLGSLPEGWPTWQ